MKNPITIAREMRGLSQSELAARTGLDRQVIWRLEAGKRNAGPKLAPALALALDVDEAWITGQPASIPVPDHIDHTTLFCPVIRAQEIGEYGIFYIVRVDTDYMTQTLPVIVGEGAVIVPRDWDAAQPLTVEAIAGHDWIAPDGSPCVMLDGLPRMGWWVP